MSLEVYFLGGGGIRSHRSQPPDGPLATLHATSFADECAFIESFPYKKLKPRMPKALSDFWGLGQIIFQWEDAL